MSNLKELLVSLYHVLMALTYKKPVRGNYVLNVIYAIDCYLNVLIGGSSKLPLTMVIFTLRRRLNAANDRPKTLAVLNFLYKVINFTTKPFIVKYAEDVTKYVETTVPKHKTLVLESQIWLLLMLGLPMLPITGLFVGALSYVGSMVGLIPKQSNFDPVRYNAERTLWKK